MTRVMVYTPVAEQNDLPTPLSQYLSQHEDIDIVYINSPEKLNEQAKKNNIDSIIYIDDDKKQRENNLQLLSNQFSDIPIIDLEPSLNNHLLSIGQIISSNKAPNLLTKNLDSLISNRSLREKLAESQIQLYGILACISDAVFIYDDERIYFTNMPAKTLLEQTNNEIYNILKTHSGVPQNPKLNVTTLDGKYFIFDCKNVPSEWEENPAELTILRDITQIEHEKEELTNRMQEHVDAYIKTSRELEFNQKRMELFLKSAGEGYWDRFIKEAEVFFSPRWKEMLGYNDDEIDPTFNAWVNLIHPDDLGNFLLVWTHYMEGLQDRFMVEYRIRTKDGRYRWVEARGVKEIDNQGHAVRLAGSHNDITERKQVEEKLKDYQITLEETIAQRTRELEKANRTLERLAKLDPLTELANRRCMDETLEQELARSTREKTPLSFIMMDIDYFKSYNDTYGHQEGDICLKLVARSISKTLLRPTDMVARYGGEEFVVILPGTDVDGCIRVANQIAFNVSRIDGLRLNPNSGRAISLSMGIAISSENNVLSLDAIVEQADKALYQAKSLGRNTICLYSDDGITSVSK